MTRHPSNTRWTYDVWHIQQGTALYEVNIGGNMHILLFDIVRDTHVPTSTLQNTALSDRICRKSSSIKKILKLLALSFFYAHRHYLTNSVYCTELYKLSWRLISLRKDNLNCDDLICSHLSLVLSDLTHQLCKNECSCFQFDEIEILTSLNLCLFIDCSS